MAAKRIELLASAAQTASGNSSSVQVSTITQAMVGVDITAVSGTSPNLTLWLEGSDDGGTTWYELVADVSLQSSEAAAPNTVNKQVRDIVDGYSTAAAAKFMSLFKELPCDYVRLRWIMSGTTPSFTFSASLVGK